MKVFQDLFIHKFNIFLYILIFGVLIHFVSLPELVKGILALPLVVIIPKKIGDLIIFILGRFTKIFCDDFSQVSKDVISWIIGIYAILIAVLFLNEIGFFSATIFIVCLISLIFISCIIHNPSISYSIKLIKFLKEKPLHILVSILALSSLIILVKYLQPYPFHYSSATLFNYIFETLKFTQGNEVILTAGVHIPIIPIIVGISSIILSVDPLAIFWAGSLLNYILFFLGVYLFSYEVTKKRTTSILSSFFAIFMFVSIEFKPLYAFSMRTILAVIFPYILFVIHKEFISKMKTNDNKNLQFLLKLTSSSIFLFFLYFVFIVLLDMKWFFLFLFLLPIIIFLLSKSVKVKYKNFAVITFIFASFFSLIHIWISLIILPILLFYIIISLFLGGNHPRNKLFIWGTIVLFSLYIGLQKMGVIKIYQGFFSQLIYQDLINIPTFNFINKFNDFIFYGPKILLSLLIVGGILILIYNHKKMLPILIVSIFSLFIYFFPEPQFFRVIVFAIPFFSLIISFAIKKIFCYISISNKLFSVIFLGIILMIIIPILFSSQIDYINSRRNSVGYFSSDFEAYDYMASNWISKNTPKIWNFDENNITFITKYLHDPRYEIEDIRKIEIPLTEDTLIISDPHTMWILEGLTGRKQLIDQRAFINLDEYSNESINRMQYIKAHVFLSNNSKDSYDLINKLKFKHNPVLIIINPRTSVWILNKDVSRQFFYNPPNKLATKIHFEKFYDTRYFTLLYHSSEDDTTM